MNRKIDVEYLLKFFSNFKPQYWLRVVGMVDHLLAVSPETYEECKDVVDLFENKPPEGVTSWGLYLMAARAEAARLWQARQTAAPQPELGEWCGQLEGRVVWGVAEILCREGRNRSREDPKMGSSMIELALKMVQSAPVDILPEESRQEFSNCIRESLDALRGNADPSEGAMARAEEFAPPETVFLDELPAKLWEAAPKNLPPPDPRRFRRK